VSTRTSSSVSEFAFVRHRTTYSLALILACAAAWTSSTALTAMAVPRTTITVRVYQTAGLPAILEQRALAEAETVLRAALVDVRWQECTGLNPLPACDVPPAPSELVLVVREGAPWQDTSATLGKALIVHSAGGVLATVYFSRVARLAKVTKTDVAVLLGRVAAHELDAGRGSAKSRGGLGVHGIGCGGDAPAAAGILRAACCVGYGPSR
jgi:hypothetical protein